MLDAVTVEERLCKLETEMRYVKEVLHHRDEIKEKVWNDLQEELLAKVKQGFDQNEIFQAETRQRLCCLETDVTTLKSDVSTLKSDVSTLKSDVSTLKSDVSTLKSDVSDIKSMLRQVLKLDQ